MNWLDILLLALLAGVVVQGFRRGALTQILAFAGFVAGGWIGIRIAPLITGSSGGPSQRSALTLIAVAVSAFLGSLLGSYLGSVARRRAGTDPDGEVDGLIDREDGAPRRREAGAVFRLTDSVTGSVVSAVSFFLIVWIIGLNLASGSTPSLERAIGRSRIMRAVAGSMPTPPHLAELGLALHQMGLPDVFAGLPPQPAAPVRPPKDAQVRAAYDAAYRSTVEVVSEGCMAGMVSQGSGWFVAPHYVVTNAHVIAGSDRQDVSIGATRGEASVVAFDPRADIAVLHVDDISRPALRMSQGVAPRGSTGAVLGYPSGREEQPLYRPVTTVPAAIKASLQAMGRDIYGREEVSRSVYEIQAKIRHGNSGGPLVLADGTVAGIVFAASTSDDRTGYALKIGSVRSSILDAVGSDATVSTGSCSLRG